MDGKSMPERVHRIDTTGLAENATPTKIAQEFILQYYSVRSRYPESLYRFYRDDSTVTMGCHQEEKVIEGKKAIEQLFSRMGYENCLNSVAAFSAHFVLPNCLTILVSGELSQNEEVSRRFCETFSLISYDVNRFYVKSHMFHFQDEAFHDITPPATTVPPFEESTKLNTEPVEDTISHVEIPVEPEVELEPEESHQSTHELQEISSQAASEDRPEEGFSQAPAVDVNHVQEDTDVQTPSDQPETVVTEETPSISTTQLVSKMTWAGVASASRSNQVSLPIAKSTTDKALTPTVQPAVLVSPVTHKDSNQTTSEEKKDEIVTPSMNGLDDRVPRLSNSARAGRGGRSANAANIRRGRSSSPRDSSKDAIKYPDEQMLFVGNVPRDCAYDDLRQLFEQFGTVLDLRINDSSLSRNGRSNANLPNYGFVVMESSEVVQTILEQRPLKLHGTQRINVEEKRVPSSSSTRGSGGSNRGSYGYSRASNTAASRQ